jgi:hypothetical protein
MSEQNTQPVISRMCSECGWTTWDQNVALCLNCGSQKVVFNPTSETGAVEVDFSGIANMCACVTHLGGTRAQAEEIAAILREQLAPLTWRIRELEQEQNDLAELLQVYGWQKAQGQSVQMFLHKLKNKEQQLARLTAPQPEIEKLAKDCAEDIHLFIRSATPESTARKIMERLERATARLREEQWKKAIEAGKVVSQLRAEIASLKDACDKFSNTEIMQGDLAAVNAELRKENETFRAAQKACEDCDAPTMAEVRELRAAKDAAEARLEEAVKALDLVYGGIFWRKHHDGDGYHHIDDKQLNDWIEAIRPFLSSTEPPAGKEAGK